MGTLSLGHFLSAIETGASLIGCPCPEVSPLSPHNRAAEIGSFIQCVHEGCQRVGLLTLPSAHHIALPAGGGTVGAAGGQQPPVGILLLLFANKY